MTDDKELRVRTKKVGQALWVLPACKQSRAIAKDMGVLTLTPVAVKALKEMGFEVKDLEEVEATQRAIAARYDPSEEGNTIWQEEPVPYRAKRKRLLPAWLIPYLPSVRANRQPPVNKQRSKDNNK